MDAAEVKKLSNEEVIANYVHIYDRFEVPPNLREHMERVASVAEVICTNWTGDIIDREEIIASALMHDIGNIVKFSFSPETKKFLGKEAGRIEYWKAIKSRMIEKYGSSDDHIVTDRMLVEAGVTERLKHIVERYFDPSTADSTDMTMKILLYADARIGPFGVVSLSQRQTDLIKRWEGTERADYYRGFEKALNRVEEELHSNMRLDPRLITNETIEPYLERYVDQDIIRE